MTRRFVVQEHRVRPDDVHFDLMIEAGDVLVTFQLEGPPGAHVLGRRSFDHRPRYLDYEGALTEGRGSVRIWDRGDVVDVVGDPRATPYRARFAGARLVGLYELTEGEARVALSPVPQGSP